MQDFTPPANSERGAALLLAIFALLIVSALSGAMLTSGRTEQMISHNQERAAQARAAAEAGLNHGTAVMTTWLGNWSANGFASSSAAMTRLLRGPDDSVGSVDADADNGSLETLGIPRPPTRATLNAAHDTSYEVRVIDEDDPARGLTLSVADRGRIGENGDAVLDGNRRLLVRSTGYAEGGTRTTLEATVGPTTLAGIVTNGDLAISGNATITGPAGSVHSNGNLSVSGNPTLSENLTSTGSYSSSGSPVVGGQTGGGHAAVPIPPVRAIDHRPNADFILTSTGRLTNQAATVLCDASSNNSACEAGYGWKFEGSNGWSIGSNAAQNGTFYVEADAKVSGNPGSAAVPLIITIIATGNIEISGNPTVQPELPGVLFVTDKDLKLGGSLLMANGIEGQILVREQLMISGNPTLAGQIMVENAATLSTLVTTNSISGNPTFSSSGLGGSNTFVLSAWREVR